MNHQSFEMTAGEAANLIDILDTSLQQLIHDNAHELKPDSVVVPEAERTLEAMETINKRVGLISASAMADRKAKVKRMVYRDGFFMCMLCGKVTGGREAHRRHVESCDPEPTEGEDKRD